MGALSDLHVLLTNADEHKGLFGYVKDSIIPIVTAVVTAALAYWLSGIQARNAEKNKLERQAKATRTALYAQLRRIHGTLSGQIRYINDTSNTPLYMWVPLYRDALPVMHDKNLASFLTPAEA